MFAGIAAGLLVCTDVAARGLDIPGVDWIIQVSGMMLLFLFALLDTLLYGCGVAFDGLFMGTLVQCLCIDLW